MIGGIGSVKMRFWLTTHYPHYQPNDVPWNVYFRPKHKKVAERLEPGDQIAFYEVGKGKTLIGRGPKPPGRMGVVRVARVSDRVRECGMKEVEPNGVVHHFKWEVRCGDHDEAGFASRAEACRAVGFKPTYKLFGLGGVRELKS